MLVHLVCKHGETQGGGRVRVGGEERAGGGREWGGLTAGAKLRA